jgi:hypothetical protein
MVYPWSKVYWNNDNSLEDENHNTKNGIYPRIVMAMIDRLAAGCATEEEDVCLSEQQKNELRLGLTGFGSILKSRFDHAQTLQ